jgi:hypothetical protein
MVALSVSISRRTSPVAKVSPSFFFHDAIPPSVMVGDMAGILNLPSAAAGADVRSAESERAS